VDAACKYETTKFERSAAAAQESADVQNMVSSQRRRVACRGFLVRLTGGMSGRVAGCGHGSGRGGRARFAVDGAQQQAVQYLALLRCECAKHVVFDGLEGALSSLERLASSWGEHGDVSPAIGRVASPLDQIGAGRWRAKGA